MRIPMYEPTKAELEQKEEGFEPSRWWRAIGPNGELLAETSSRSDFKHLGLDKRDDVKYYRLYERVEQKVVEDNPFTVNTNEED